MLDVRVAGDEAAEIVIENVRGDIEQAINVRSRHADLHTVADSDSDSDDADAFDTDDGLGFEQITMLGAPNRRIEITAAPDLDRTLQLWNTWLVGDAHHAWTGNSGIVAEELDVPDDATRRVRLWCSDGLGDPSFDDLVLVVTVGPRAQSAHQPLAAAVSSEDE